MPTFNEENYVEEALRSIRFADEIIVIDSFSTDRTPEIAQEYATIFLQREFDDFSKQKNFAMQHATSEWLLFLDADERITYPLQLEIKEAMKNDQFNGYTLKFPHFFMNQFLYHHYDEVLRLVRRDGAKFSGNVHEKLNCNGKVGRLKNYVLHYTYKGLQNYIRKKESYAWFQAERLYEKGKKATFAHFLFKPLFRFFKSYLIKGGFRDGIPGLTVSALNAYGVFARYVKLRLLKKRLR